MENKIIPTAEEVIAKIVKFESTNNMKAQLVKRQDRFDLYNESDGSKIASTSPNPMGKLSLKNCQAIENGYDLDEIVEQTKQTLEDSRISSYDSFKIGFQKALEIIGKKKFSEEDVRKAFESGYETLESDRTYNEHYEEMIQSLQQTEWDVEIVTEDSFTKNDEVYVDETNAKGNYSTHSKIPKLDADGCLILKTK